MFCPECEGEFREGITSCPDCEVELVVELAQEEHDNTALVSVFSTAHPAVLPVARSLLDETEIPYTIRGEETLGLFPGTGGAGLMIDPRAKAAEVLVPASRAAEARELLEGLDEPDDSEE